MAITKAKKDTLVADLTTLLNDAKLTAYARYQGLTVAELQELRKAAREAGVKIKVVKNRLVRVAMKEIGVYQTHPALELAGGFNNSGKAMDQAEITTLAKMPSKNELIAQVVAQLLSPINDTVSGVSGGLSGIISGLEAKAA